MTRQRGLGLIELAIYAVIAIAVMGALFAAWTAFKHSIAAPYVEEQRQADQKALNAMEADRDAALRDRETAKGNQDRCDAALKIAQDATLEWTAAAIRAADAAKRAKVDSAREAAAMQPRIAAWQAAAAEKPKRLACEEELAKAKDVLRDALRQRRQPAAK